MAVGDTVVIPERTRAEYDRQKQAAKQGCTTAIITEPYLTPSGCGQATHGARGIGGGPGQVGYQATIRRCYKIMHQTNPLVTSCDWFETLIHLTGDHFAYIDPPYIGANVGTYKPSDLSHEELVSVLETAPYKWVLSEYAHPLYMSRLGAPFYRQEMRHLDSRGRGKVVECLWKNF